MAKLKLPTGKMNISVLGVGQLATNIKFKTRTRIKSEHNNFRATIDFLILNKITSSIPAVTFDISNL